MKPNIFIGSSSEALKHARSIKEELAKHFSTRLWTDNIFALGEDTLDGLLRFVQCYDFAILVVTGDDLVESRNLTSVSPRDNVILELGLFMGALGRRRTFPIVIHDKAGPPKIPTDLLGNTAVFMAEQPGGGLHVTTGLTQLIRTVEERSKESFLNLLPSTALAIGYYQNFVLPVCQELARRESVCVFGEDFDISEDNYKFTIVLPSTLADSSRHGANRFVKKHGMTQFHLSLGCRDYPFYVGAESSGNSIKFYDYPTTLNASQKAISLALPRSSIGPSAEMSMLGIKELANFQRTIETLLREPESAEFRDNVNFMLLN